MRILIPVPWKPIVLVWGLLSAMILVGFIASSVVQGRDPFAPRPGVAQSPHPKGDSARSGQQAKHSHEVSQIPNR